MTSVRNEINEILVNTINDLESKLENSKNVLSNIQEKMDAKVNEAKEYKVQVDNAKDNIKRLENEIDALETDLKELKEKYGKKNLVAVIDAGTKEINGEIKKKQDEIQVHKNKIAELTNKARSIKDLLMNLKKDKKIKEERLEDLESCTKYYKERLDSVVSFANEHENLDDYFVTYEENEEVDNSNVFEDIVGSEEENNLDEEVNKIEENQEEVSLEMTDEIFNDVLNNEEEIEENIEDNANDLIETNEEKELDNISEEQQNTIDDVKFEDDSDLNNTRDLEINDLLSSVKEPVVESKEEKLDKVANINKAIDTEFANIFGSNINEPINTIDIFGNGYNKSLSEEDIVSKLTDIGIDYYSFKDEDKEVIKNNFNEQTVKDIVNILKENKIQLDNIYVDGSILSSIAPAELSSIIEKLLTSGQSADAIGYVLDKLPLVDIKLLNDTILNYGDYIKNVDIVDIIIASLKGEK